MEHIDKMQNEPNNDDSYDDDDAYELDYEEIMISIVDKLAVS